ncbi:hypothetical protein EOD41_15275 [Mucilaginibacter limnophilus]|uniref:Pyruvate carboxyltransferase domain-containing protein n=1 Tax=Mucilaginibacter limnophilus TaxID=1932778 RepID=A0A3S2UKG2_9SPHI|nr:aldolase catalytic domain-containing protein [Mucilaginibacter limnophilus]RVT99801.1 hypothetical protein EOD41_15275 [Mucilaginibacter limnophilus]
MFKILDCTLRDGGYYTNWDFDTAQVDTYIQSLNRLPVEYIELGYRSHPMKAYHGKYFYCPVYELERIKKLSNKKLAVILNEKEVSAQNVGDLLQPCSGLVDLVRIAVTPQNLGNSLALAEKIKTVGFEVALNVMYMSKWPQQNNLPTNLKQLDGLADYFYMVDSYGGVYPEDVKQTIAMVREHTLCKIGFHGHNNLELALINTLSAIDNGADIVDATILGMGRGAGNLKTELLLSVLNTKHQLQVDFNALGNAVDCFEPLLQKHQWGTNVPYMISGTNSLPQKDVMDWVTTRLYSFNSIVRALQNQKNNISDNQKCELFKPQKQYSKVLIIGGGPSATSHADAVKQFISRFDDIALVHASSKNSASYKDLDVDQFYCLVGNEGDRLEKAFARAPFNGTCVLPPYPRKMGTYVPPFVSEKAFEVEKVTFTDKVTDSHAALALQTALELKPNEIFIIGYDGYAGGINETQMTLIQENEYLFGEFEKYAGIKLQSLTPTRYKKLNVSSVYTFI